MYEYEIDVLRVIDGDTIVAQVDLGFHVTKRETLRLAGINTPELNDPNRESRAKAVEAWNWVRRVLIGAVKVRVTVRTEKPYVLDKYGRWLATIWYQELGKEAVNLNSELVTQGLALEYKRG